MLAFLLLSAVGWIAESFNRRLGLLSLPFYFMAINTALFIAWFRNNVV